MTEGDDFFPDLLMACQYQFSISIYDSARRASNLQSLIQYTLTPGPGKGAGNVPGIRAGIATQTAAAAVTGSMTAEEAMIATMTGKEREIPGSLVVMIPEATAGHIHQGEVLGIMIDLGMFTYTSVSMY